MFFYLKRHPIPIVAEFEFTLVLTYAFNQNVLESLLPPGLELDTFQDLGFVAIALVQTNALRPQGFPRFLGGKFFLSGYRIFSRYQTKQGRRLRGLRILRSDTNKWAMSFFGNILTHYNYQYSDVSWTRDLNKLEVTIKTSESIADLKVSAQLNDSSEMCLPKDSPFKTEKEARRFAGPLPFTFEYEKETNSIVRIQGIRQKWSPKLVPVQVKECTFFNKHPFSKQSPILASAFFLEKVPYRWNRGIRERLNSTVQ
jgi:hypothetical protein